MGRARAAHATERADEAEAALKEVLAQSPKDFEARRLMADVHRFRGQFEKTEAELEALWKEKGFADDTKEFPPQERAYRDLLENQFNELYSRWSTALDPAKEPDKFEKVVHAGLVWNKKSATLNRILVDHYLARADALQQEGKKLEAAAAYDQVLQLRAMPAQRKDAQAEADSLRKAVFVDEINAKFAAMKAELATAGQWDEESKTLTFVVEFPVSKRLKQKKEADLATARKEATGAIRSTIATWVAKVTGLAPELAAMTAPAVGSGDEKLGGGKYAVSVSMKLEDVIEAAYVVKLKADAAAKKAAADAANPTDPPADTEEPPAGTNAGAAPAGTTGTE